MSTVLELSKLTYAYRTVKRPKTILRGVDYAFEAGVFYAVSGRSGSGKTTLLSLASGLDSPTGGAVRFRGRDIAEIGLGRYRRRYAATVFQSLNLLDYLNAVQNVTAAMEITGVRERRKKRRAIALLEGLGLDAEDLRRRPPQLSGGQQQRVAIARALACEVDVLFADEPTGSLDGETADDIVRTFRSLAHDHGKCVIVVTHAKQVADAADEVLNLRKGKLS
ncbi:ABC transporter ATP-binding protein [Glycomyces sp. NPDC046736]|uniref:ABC transporter ATP-binding protein n=1 Tax=Glycomyces sp. NPDC046736 TaxID=3155615 RepID=UPI0033EF96C7